MIQYVSTEIVVLPVSAVKMEDREAQVVQVTNNRCLPNKLIIEFDRMRTAHQKSKIDSLDDVGFGGFKLLKISRIYMPFLKWTYENFNPTTLEVLLNNGKKLKLSKEDVCRVYGLPMGPKSIQLAFYTSTHTAS